MILHKFLLLLQFLQAIANVRCDSVGYDYENSNSGEVDDAVLTDADFAAAGSDSTIDDDGEDDDMGDKNNDPLFGGDGDYFEGDIKFREGFTIWSYVKPSDVNGTQADGYRSAVKSEHRLWDDGIIPYVITANMNDRERKVVAKAILEYSKHTCIKWTPRSGEEDYVRIMRGEPGSGCWSNVGKLGWINIINLGPQCFRTGTVVHEMMHTAGFFHEHSRADRDDYVTFVPENLKEKKYKKNFIKFTLEEIDHLGTEYDCGSIMHYPLDAFALQ